MLHLTILFSLLAFLLPAQITLRTRQEWTRINPVTPLTAATFAKPPATDKPWVRFNMPPTADPAEIAVEVQSLAANGIAGIEVGQGAYPNNAQLVSLLTAANKLGLKVSLSHGPTQNPSGYSIDSDHARKSLFLGKATVNAGATFDGALPAPTLTQGSRGGFGGRPPAGGARAPQAPAGPPPQRGPQAKRADLIAVLAYRCTASPCPATGPIELDHASAIDLTANVASGNTLHWTAPASATPWQLIAFWSRGVFAQPDPFSSEGTAELIASMEAGFSPEVKQLLKANGGDIFYDSHSSDRGSPDELWTNRMAEEFLARRKYPLKPQLPALFREIFDFNDGSAPRVREDFYAVRGDLWIEKHLVPLRQWVRKYDNVLRVQVEGEANLTIPITDMVLATAVVDRPEHESLFVGDEIDNYLPMASANHMTGNPWYSTECCPALQRNYAQSLQDTVIRMHRSFIGGITKLIYHVYPYRDSETAKWPGYHNFGQAGFSNGWGPRAPHWATHAPLYNAYFARNQQVLTQGDAKTDVAVYMQNYLYPPSQGIKMRHWQDTKLQEAGYTRDYLNPDMLELPNATVIGKRLAVPAYKAFVIDAEQGPPTDPVKTAMPVRVAQKILGYARAGLPIVIVGPPPSRTPGNDRAADAELQKVIASLLAEPTVSRVAYESEVPAKLRALGIRPAAEPDQPSSLLSVRRHDAATKTDYYFFYNQGIVSPEDEPFTLFDPATGKAVEREVSLEGSGRPYLLDAWSGRITPITGYTARDGRVTVRVKLSPDNGMLLALTPDAKRFGSVAASKPSSTQGAPLDLTAGKWQVTAEDWQPANSYATTFGPAASQTRKAPVQLELSGGLKPWPQIPELQHASGVATYTTTFEWKSGGTALLSLGEVFDTFDVTVNGKPVETMNQLSAEGETPSGVLKPGRNTLTVRVATTLNNRLAKLDEDVARRGITQPYGLVGPVVLTPR